MLGFIMSCIVQAMFLFCSIVQVYNFGHWSDWMIGLVALNVSTALCTYFSWKEYKNEQ